METMPKSSNPLETEPLSKLLLRYSIPTTLTLMVNYLYSIVDQIFVGQGVGITGMAAVNVAFPVSILVNAVSLLLGDGCAAQRQPVSGAQGAGNGKPHLRSCRYLDHHQRHCSGTGLWHFHARRS